MSRIREQVVAATAEGRTLDIVGGGSKAFLASGVGGEALTTTAHAGIVDYQPSELVITARAGTPLADVEAALAERGQMLGFEPPRLAAASTIGGVVACGWSGPARPFRGSTRDFVLGVELVNGRGEVLRFGGQVMKNVAGYDISRLVTGAFGALGVITEVSLRVVPRPAVVRTLHWQCAPDAARQRVRELSRAPWPLTAVAWDAQLLRVRVAGSVEAVDDAARRLPADAIEDDHAYWDALRDLRLPSLQPPAGSELWRLSLPATAPDPAAHAVALNDWSGAQRWLHASDAADALRAHCAAAGGHATCIRRASAATPVFQSPAPAERALMQRVKRAFDGANVFNPQRYFDWM